jgi:hypothetical protein
VIAALLCVAPVAVAQDAARVHIAVVPGLTIVQTLHTPEAERESLIRVEEASRGGVLYRWWLFEVHARGDTVEEHYQRFVSTADLAGARRLRAYHANNEPVEHPSYTSWTLSTAVYQQLRTTGTADYSILSAEDRGGTDNPLSGFGLGGGTAIVRWRGSLRRVGAGVERFPLLLNGSRVAVPALHLTGEFTSRENRWTPDIWVLADSAHPLLLKMTKGPNVLQTVRIEHLGELVGLAIEAGSGPDGELDGASDGAGAGSVESAAAALGGAGGGRPGGAGARRRGLEGALTRLCRVEVPGVYFAFNSAEIVRASFRLIV